MLAGFIDGEKISSDCNQTIISAGIPLAKTTLVKREKILP
jgi:hypothetical protein